MRNRRKRIWVSTLGIALLTVVGLGCSRPAETVGPREDYAAVARQLERFISHEMDDKSLPALSIALVDDQEVVWARGFGLADPGAKASATAQTVYRVGSVSKLFTDIAIMQLVERGEIDLDAPVTRYIPAFAPNNPFDKPITLRQLMSHRSGLVREPPVGNYFDPSEPSLADTVASLNQTTLVYEPETRTKYSNGGIGLVGYVLERTQGEPFTHYLQRAVLAPLKMEHSSFEPTPAINRKLAKAVMWTYDGRVFDAPTFQLGMAPAGSMYSTVLDLSRFMSVLFNGGTGPDGPVLRPESLEAMWTPQYAPPEATSGFGIGFSVSELEGHRRVGHGGAIYGFATTLAALPDDKLGAVVVASKDVANSVTNRVADYGLKAMLAVGEGRELPQPVLTDSVPPERARRLRGRYARDGGIVELAVRGDRLYMITDAFRVALRSLGDKLVVDDAHAFGTEVVPVENSLVVDGETYERLPPSAPLPAAERWRDLLGEYGWDHNTLYIFERDRRLYALIEWFFFYPLQELSRDRFAFPDTGLYHGEQLHFVRAEDGRVTGVEAAGVLFKRRSPGAEEGATFRIEPIRPVNELRREALGAQPPVEEGEFRKPDLVDLSTLDSTIKFDIRYATTNNFMSTVFYQQPKAFLQRPAAEALLRAHQTLAKHGYGLLIHDAYRPWYVTKMFWDATPDDKRIFVADPSRGSRHNRGCAVDLTLYDRKTGKLVQMVGGYDEMSARSSPDYPGGTSLERWHRELLRGALEAEGFRVYEFEWWHFDYQDWQQYPILNLTFEQILSAKRGQ